MRIRMLHPAVSLVAILLLAGCVPTDPIITPAPEPDAAPIFASDEEALAAATDAYARYLKVSDEISTDGGAAPERLANYVTKEQLVREIAAFNDLATSESTTSGPTEFEIFQLQRYDDSLDGIASITVYVCLDVGKVRVLDKAGSDITPKDRNDRFPLEVGFEVSGHDPSKVLVERSEPWSGKDFCN